MLRTNQINNHVHMYKPIKREYGNHIIKAGEELGMFKMGSSVVALLEVPKGFEFTAKENEKVRYGQVIGKAPKVA